MSTIRNRVRHQQFEKLRPVRVENAFEALLRTCANLSIADRKRLIYLLLKQVFLPAGTGCYIARGEWKLSEVRPVYLSPLDISTNLAASWFEWARALSNQGSSCRPLEGALPHRRIDKPDREGGGEPVAPGLTELAVLRWGLTVGRSGRRGRRLRLIVQRSLKLSRLPQRSLSAQASSDTNAPLSINPSKSAIRAGHGTNAAAGTNQGHTTPQGPLADPSAGAAFASGCLMRSQELQRRRNCLSDPLIGRRFRAGYQIGSFVP
jgi:hypothetical protein